MLDSYNRTLNYLRISVTDRCNLKCTYCIPEGCEKHLNHEDILSFEEIVEVTKVAVNYGVNKVRITGGEPLVRKDILILVKMLSEIKGIKDLSMTTNGILLSKMAQGLKMAGLQRVNISLDAIDADKYFKITRGGDVNLVFEGIKAAKMAKLTPIKINCVIKKDKNEKDALEVFKYCLENNLEIRYIHQMDLKSGHFAVVEGGDGGNCRNCNRLRLTADGKLKPCLFSNIEYDIRIYGIQQAILMAANNKPKCGSFNNTNQFHNIGG